MTLAVRHVTSLAVFSISAVFAAQERAANPDTILAAAREALGGHDRLASVKTLVATGRTRQVRGENLVPIEFEISCELPDKYVRRDEFPAQDAGPTSTGFNGDALIQRPPPGSPISGRPGGPPPTAAQLEAARDARLASVKQDFARLMFGMFAGSFSSFPVTFVYAGAAEAPQGQADVLDAKGPGNFTARLFVHKTTHLPIMISWRGSPGGPGRGLRGGPPRGGPPPGESAPAAGARGTPPPSAPPGSAPTPSAPGSAPASAPGAPPPQGPGARPGGPGAQGEIETRLYFADYRDVEGLKWPFRIRRALGADTVEETIVDRFSINRPIDPKKFETK